MALFLQKRAIVLMILFFFSISVKPFYLQKLLFVLKMYLKMFKTSLLAVRLYAIVKCIYSCIEFLKQSFKVKNLLHALLFLFLSIDDTWEKQWMWCSGSVILPLHFCKEPAALNLFPHFWLIGSDSPHSLWLHQKYLKFRPCAFF